MASGGLGHTSPSSNQISQGSDHYNVLRPHLRRQRDTQTEFFGFFSTEISAQIKCLTLLCSKFSLWRGPGSVCQAAQPVLLSADWRHSPALSLLRRQGGPGLYHHPSTIQSFMPSLGCWLLLPRQNKFILVREFYFCFVEQINLSPACPWNYLFICCG